MFLSSQWQRSPSACSASSTHHASKFPPLYFDVFWMRLRCLALWCQCFLSYLFQMGVSGSTAGRLMRRATATRSCAPADRTTRPPLAEHQPPMGGWTDKWVHQKTCRIMFSPRMPQVWYFCIKTSGKNISHFLPDDEICATSSFYLIYLLF